jgi:general stress protein 26
MWIRRAKRWEYKGGIVATKAQLKKEIFRWFKKMQVIYLATARGRKPQVRPVAMIYHRKKFWITTGTRDAKVKQITKNTNVQFCLLLKRGKNQGTLRADCRARIVKDKKTRHLLAKIIPWFKHYWKSPDDPSFCLIELVMKQIEYMKPGKMISEKIAL